MESLSDHFAEGTAVAVFNPVVRADEAEPSVLREEREPLLKKGDIEVRPIIHCPKKVPVAGHQRTREGFDTQVRRVADPPATEVEDELGDFRLGENLAATFRCRLRSEMQSILLLCIRHRNHHLRRTRHEQMEYALSLIEQGRMFRLTAFHLESILNEAIRPVHGLMPLLFANGAGADTMSRLAAPIPRMEATVDGSAVASNLRFGALGEVCSGRQRFDLKKIFKPEQSDCPPVLIKPEKRRRATLRLP